MQGRFQWHATGENEKHKFVTFVEEMKRVVKNCFGEEKNKCVFPVCLFFYERNMNHHNNFLDADAKIIHIYNFFLILVLNNISRVLSKNIMIIIKSILIEVKRLLLIFV